MQVFGTMSVELTGMKEIIMIKKKYGGVIALVAFVLLFILNSALLFREKVQPAMEISAHVLGWYLFLTGMLILLTVAGVFLIFRRKWPIHWVFAVTALIAGVLYMCILPPYSTPDEHAHFSTAYYYSNNLMGEEAVNAKGKTLMRSRDVVFEDKEHRNPSLRTYETISEDLLKKDDSAGTKAYKTKPLEGLSTVAYFPQVLGITIARILGTSNLMLLFMGRFFALLFYIALVTLAIRFIPFGKAAMFAVGMFPMSMHLAASYSYDVMVLSMSFFFIGYTLYLAYDKQKVRVTDWIFLGISMAVLTPIKLVYVFMVLLCLLIPAAKSISKKRHWICTGIVLGSGVLSLAILRLSALLKYLTRTETTAAYTGKPGYTVGYLLSHLEETVKLFYNTLKNQGAEYLYGSVGNKLGWLEINIHTFWIWCFLIILLMGILCSKGEKQFIQGREKLLMGFISLAVIGSTMLALCLSWTVQGTPIIEGIQGRYFLPVLPLIALLFRNRSLEWEKSPDGGLAMAVLLLQAPVLWSVFEIIISR